MYHRRFGLLMILAVLCAAPVRPQEPDAAWHGGDNAIMVDLTGMSAPISDWAWYVSWASSMNAMPISYERVLTARASLFILGAFGNTKAGGEEVHFREMHLGGRYYPGRNMAASHGSFLALEYGRGSGEYRDASYSADDENVTIAVLKFGLGYKGVWASGFIQEFEICFTRLNIETYYPFLDDTDRTSEFGTVFAYRIGFTF